jgi:hypothetical protein
MGVEWDPLAWAEWDPLVYVEWDPVAGALTPLQMQGVVDEHVVAEDW